MHTHCSIDLDQADVLGVHGGVTYRKAVVVFADGSYYASWRDWPHTPACQLLTQQVIIDAQQEQLTALQQQLRTLQQQLHSQVTAIARLERGQPQLPAPAAAPDAAFDPCPYCDRTDYTSRRSRTMHVRCCTKNPDRRARSGAITRTHPSAEPPRAPVVTNGHRPEEDADVARPLG